MRSKAPKVRRNETMTLSDRKHFAAMIEISREEQLMNIIERMDKFRCDDSDDE